MRHAAREEPHPHSRRHARLAYAAAVGLVIALGLQLYWPTLDLGLFADDYVIVAAVDGELAAPRGALDLFNFVDGTPEDVRALQRLGSIAWWASPDLRVSFLRPMSSALVHLDRALFGDVIAAHHAHSLAAWALLVVAAGALYARLWPSPVIAALATAFFAFDQSQHGPVMWLCNRGALYAVLLGTLGIAAHVRARRSGERAFAAWSAVCLAAALAFGEWAVPMFAYVLAFELAGARDAVRARIVALLPPALLLAGFLIARALLGYGARGSGVYVDPAASPLDFALLLAHRLPVFVADMAFNLPASLWDSGSPWRDAILELELVPPTVWVKLPGWRPYHVAAGIVAIIVVGAALRFCWSGLSRDERVTLRFLLLGAALGLVPVAGAFPSTRLTLAASLGFAPAAALFLRQLARRMSDAPRLRPARFFALYLPFVGVLYVQLFEPLTEDLQPTVDHFRTATEWVLAAELDPARVAEQRVFLLNGAEFTTTFFFAYTWGYHDRPLPRSYVPISTAPYAQELERQGDRVLLLRALGGGYFESPSEVHYRAPDRPLRAGDAVQIEGVRIEVAREIRDRPQALRLTFDRSLDDPSLVFLTATEAGFTRFDMPAVGERRRLRRAAPPDWLKLERTRHERRIGPLPSTIAFEPLPAFVAFQP